MIRLTTILFFLLLLSSCAYKSVIIAPKYKKNVFSGRKDAPQTSTQRSETGILNSSISLDQMLNQSNRNGNSDGSYFCFLSNEDIFMYATNISESKDSSIVLEGYLYDKTKGDTINFKINSRTGIDDIKIDKIDETFFLLTHKEYSRRDFLERGSFDVSYVFYNTNNYIVSKNTLELLTGEIRDNRGYNYKYIIVNDPNEIKKVLKSVCILTVITKNSPELIEKCRRLLENKCPKNFYVDIDYYLSFSKDVICKCK